MQLRVVLLVSVACLAVVGLSDSVDDDKCTELVIAFVVEGMALVSRASCTVDGGMLVACSVLEVISLVPCCGVDDAMLEVSFTVDEEKLVCSTVDGAVVCCNVVSG